ncbi:MAG: PhnD/SsuA/transferrin family substrate-binding protein [Lacipirellulaceae bacterium]
MLTSTDTTAGSEVRRTPGGSAVKEGVSERWSWGLIAGLLFGLCLAIALVGWAARVAMQRESRAEAQDSLLGFTGLGPSVRKSLDAKFVDADGDLLADPPTSPDQFAAPYTLVLAHYLGDDEGQLRVDWESLREKLSVATGLTVKVQAYLHTPEEVAAIAAGKIHLLAAHSAEMPNNVNSAGVVPFAELASRSATDGNRSLIAAVAGGAIRSLDDLRGQTLVCTSPDSITGYRAAIVAVYLETGMLPNEDYRVAFSHKHEWSARGLVVGKFPVVALSDDVVQRMASEDRLRESEYQVLYKSDPIPRLTIARVHDLSPEIARAVTDTVLAFENRVGEQFRFQPVDYQRDYEFVRRLDDAFSPRFGDIFMVEE